MIRDYIAASLLSLAVLGAIVAACSLAVLTYRALADFWRRFVAEIELEEQADRLRRAQMTEGYMRWRRLQSLRAARGFVREFDKRIDGKRGA